MASSTPAVMRPIVAAYFVYAVSIPVRGGEVRPVEQACGFEGNRGSYGLGVRIAFYLQAATVERSVARQSLEWHSGVTVSPRMIMR